MKSVQLPILLPATAWLVSGIGGSVAATTLDLSQHSQESAWLQPYDPTLVTRRFLTELSYEDDDNGDLWKIETSLRWGIPIHDDLAFGLQALMPVKWADSPGGDDFGLGDLEFRAGLVGRLSPTLRYGAGVNAELDTAADPSLGSNALVLRPILAIRWDVSNRVNLGMNAEYSITPQDQGPDDVSALELKLPVVVKLTDHWSIAATYKPRWNFLTDDVRHRLDLGGNYVFGRENRYGLSFALEIPLSSESFDWKLTTGFTWHL